MEVNGEEMPEISLIVVYAVPCSDVHPRQSTLQSGPCLLYLDEEHLASESRPAAFNKTISGVALSSIITYCQQGAPPAQLPSPT